MKYLLLLFLLLGIRSAFGQRDDRISTLDFVQILNGNTEEARFYYQNNWKRLRESAIDKGYIHSYEILETKATENAPFDFILITTYANQELYDKREYHFEKLIAQAGGQKLLNDKQPTEFRKNLFNKEAVEHWKTEIDRDSQN